MKKIILSSILSLSLLPALNADDIGDFESLLDNVSEIATKKSLNVDYLPSVVTVVDAQTYIDGGIQNIGEALGMLPGIQMQLSPMGYNITTVRGFKNPNAYLSDKIKILIDGVAINNEIQGSSSFYMDFPMRLVDKIEVLRGPGSTVYGAGAFYATVNVITKMGNNLNEKQLFVGTGSYKDRTVGGSFYTTAGKWKIFTDGYYKQNDKHVDLPADFSPNGTQTDEAMQDFTLGFKAVNGGFEFLARYKENSYGNFYGFEEDLDPIGNQDKEHMNSYFFSQLSYKTSFDGYKLQTKANFSHRELDVGANIYSVADTAARFAVVDIDMQEGFFYHENSQEQNYEVEAILTLPEIKSNDILIGAGARRAEVVKDDFYSSIENAITANKTAIENHPNFSIFRYRPEAESAFWANPTTTLLKNDPSRDILYSYLQDLISLSEDVDLSLGLRADNYSDFGTKFSKRAALVYRASDEAVFKLLYGSAFRAPTLIEAYQNGHINFRAGDENILPEESDTYEVAAIYSPNFYNKFSLNLFYSQLSNVIDLEEYPDTDPGYRNYRDRVSKGAEFEYFFRTVTKHNLYFNATYLDTVYAIPPEYSDPSWDQSMPDISKIMLKAMYIYTPISALSFGTTWRYNSATTATELSWPDEPVAPSHHIFDETITYRFSPSSEARLTVKNLFDEEVYMPSYYYGHDGGIPREGRHFFLNFTQKF